MKASSDAALVALLLLVSSLGLAQQPAVAEAESLTHMNELMQQIRTVEDPEQRAELLEQHLTEMHAAMARIHGELGQLMAQVEEQKRESRRLHDHARTKR